MSVASIGGLSTVEYTLDDRGVPRGFCNDCDRCDKYTRPKDPKSTSIKCICGHLPPAHENLTPIPPEPTVATFVGVGRFDGAVIDVPKPLPKKALLLKDDPKESAIYGLAMYTYETKPPKLPFSKGDKICIIDRSDPDWWRGYVVTDTNNDEYPETGYFPRYYCKLQL